MALMSPSVLVSWLTICLTVASMLCREMQRVLNDSYRARLSCDPVMWLLARPLPPSPSQQDVSLFQSSCVRGGGGRGAKSYDREKAWLFINALLLLTRGGTLRIKIDIYRGPTE
jgi:hypothetical protein